MILPSVWKGMKDITSYKSPSPALWRINNWQTSSNPSLPHTYNSDKRRRCAPGLQKEQKKESTRPRRCVTSLPKNLCWPASPLLHNRSSTDQLELCEVPSWLQTAPPSSPSQRTQITGLNDYRPVALTSVVMKSFERLVLAYLKDITATLTGPPAVCLQSKQVCGWGSQHGTALHPAASGQTRDLCEDPCLWTSAPLLTPSSRTPFRIN